MRHEAWNIIDNPDNQYHSLQIHVRTALLYRYIYTDASYFTIGGKQETDEQSIYFAVQWQREKHFLP